MPSDLDEAKQRGSKLLLDIARACPGEIDPTRVSRVAFLLDPPPRRPRPEELYALGLTPHASIDANIETTFAAPTVADLEYARDLLGQYVNGAENNAGSWSGAERQAELVNLPYYRRCLNYLATLIAALDAN